MSQSEVDNRYNVSAMITPWNIFQVSTDRARRQSQKSEYQEIGQTLGGTAGTKPYFHHLKPSLMHAPEQSAVGSGMWRKQFLSCYSQSKIPFQ
jgi:hypothetical protein